MKRFLLRRHGRYSFELKIRYLLNREVKKRRNYFNIKFYLFFPYSFNINPFSYPKEHFYEDQKLYLRFNTPVFTPQELTSEANSPFVRCRERPIDTDDYMYETKLCGSVCKSMVRDAYYKIRKRISREQPEEWGGDVQSLVLEIAAVARHFHETALLSKDLPEKIQYHTRLIDEYISLTLEKYFIWLFDLFYTYKSVEDIKELVQHTISEEMNYRREKGYSSVSGSDETADSYEEYAYRAKILKRYASDVLFFNVRRKSQGKRVEHILYAVAAGIAMFFATAIAFLGQTTFGNLSTSLFILLVVSYMLKDRLKDIFRDLFSKSIGSFFYDRGVKVYDPRLKRKMAHVKERVSFVDTEKLPPEVRKARSRGSFEEFLSATASENVLLYEKSIRLNAKTLRNLHSRIKGIADINIISLRRLLRYLTVQRRDVPLVAEGKIKKLIPVKRIYHLNMVVWYQGDDTSFVDRVRLIVDGKGIKRIEEVSH